MQARGKHQSISVHRIDIIQNVRQHETSRRVLFVRLCCKASLLIRRMHSHKNEPRGAVKLYIILA